MSCISRSQLSFSKVLYRQYNLTTLHHIQLYILIYSCIWCNTELQTEGDLPVKIKFRQMKYLNSIVKQAPRFF